MSQKNRKNPRTAVFDQSIWRDLSEDTFRTNLVELEQRTNAVPVHTQIFQLDAHVVYPAEEARLLPIAVEQKLADDLAYIAAVGEGAQSVSAVCVEENFDPSGLTFRLAAVDAFKPQLQHALAKVGCILERASADSSHYDYTGYANDLFRLLVEQHYQKLLGRLRSVKWQKPKYLTHSQKKPLWRDFDNLIHRVQFIYPKKKNTNRIEVELQLQNLMRVLESFEVVEARSEAEFDTLICVIDQCYMFCQYSEMRDFAAKLEALSRSTPQIAASTKTLRQVEKIGAYRRIAVDLVSTARQYQTNFQKISFRYLQPYTATETEVGYESWAKVMHVHAEVQLAVYYDTLNDHLQECPDVKSPRLCRPRIIGTSKYLCYLCYQFLKHHGVYFPSNTHGRLYDQWTIPDLNDYSYDTIQKYRSVIEKISNEVVNLSADIESREGKREPWRSEPMTSRQNLLLTNSD